MGFPVAAGWLQPSPDPTTTGFAITGRLATCSAQETWAALDPDWRSAIDTLVSDLAHLDTASFDPLGAIAARTLLIHRWRCLILRWPELPPDLMSKPPGNLRAAVAKTYDRPSPAPESWLGAEIGDVAAMSKTDDDFANRFKSQAGA